MLLIFTFEVTKIYRKKEFYFKKVKALDFYGCISGIITGFYSCILVDVLFILFIAL